MFTKLQIMELFSVIPDSIFNKIFFLYKNRYWPDFTNPQSFNEKINYIKLYDKNPLRTLVADRIKVQEYISKISSKCNLIKILWSGENFTKDIFSQMPTKFVIKANHGSGMVQIVDKNKVDFQTVQKKIEGWLEIDYGKITRQPAYNNIEKTYIVEEFLDFGLEVIPDYKFMCFNGKVEFIQVDSDRFTEHKRNLYSKNFSPMNIRYEFNQGDLISKPNLLTEAISIAEELSREFDFLRVDLYISDTEIYFGELTNTPDNGFGRFYPKEFDFQLGKKMFLTSES